MFFFVYWQRYEIILKKELIFLEVYKDGSVEVGRGVLMRERGDLLYLRWGCGGRVRVA